MLQYLACMHMTAVNEWETSKLLKSQFRRAHSSGIYIKHCILVWLKLTGQDVKRHHIRMYIFHLKSMSCKNRDPILFVFKQLLLSMHEGKTQNCKLWNWGLFELLNMRNKLGSDSK